MKKFLAKLGIFVAVSMMLAGLNTGFAETDQEILDFYASLKGEQCITDNDREKGYIITFIEEPFGDLENYKQELGEKNHYEVRTCYRNLWIPNKEGLTIVLSQNLKTCSSKDRDGYTHTCQEITAILSAGGTTMISGYIGTIYRWAASLVGIIAVLVIVLSGIQLAASGGDSQATESAKKRIVQSLSGIAVLFLSGLILYTINPNFFTAP